MNVLDAAAAALQDAGGPLHYRELTHRILKQGLWQTEGKTPEATINARIAVDISEQGQASRFQRTDKGTFALRRCGLPEYRLSTKNEETEEDGDDLGAPAPAKVLSFTDAAERVLEEFGGKKPMHYRKIAEKALELGLVATAGKTPEATLYAQVLTEIQRKSKRGDTPRFVKHGKGYIGLSRWMASGLAFQIEQHNAAVGKKLRAQLFDITAPEFEELIGKLLGKLGFEDVEVTRHSGDKGIDVRGTLVVGDVIRIRMAVQAKKWKDNVQSPTVQQVRGSLGTHEQGLIITTSDFSPGAQKEAARANAVPVALMNGEQLVKLLMENDIGVTRKSYALFELGEAQDDEPL
jgi:restriction system protein